MKKVFINTFYQAAGKTFTSLLGVIAFSLLAHYFNVEKMGEYNLVFNFVSFLAIFADFGLGTLLIREIASKNADSHKISYIFSLRLILSVIFIGIGSFLIFVFPYSYDVKLGVIIYAFANIFSQVSAIIWSIFQAHFNFIKVVFVQIVISLMNCLLIILAVSLKLPFLLIITLISITAVSGFIITRSILQDKLSFKFNKKQYIAIIYESWPLGAGIVASVFYFKIDALILPYFYNPIHYPDVAYYGTSYKIFEVALVFGGYYTGTLFPHFSSLINSKSFQKDLRKSLFYTLGLAVLGSAGIYIFAKIFIVILGGVKYLPAVTSLQILSLAFFPTILAGYFLDIGVAGKKQFLFFKCTVAAAVVNIILNIIIIPHYSFIGASWITVITQFFILITYIYIALPVIQQKRFIN